MPTANPTGPYSLSDGTRTVTGPNENAVRKVLTVCQNNPSIVSDATFDTFLQGLTTVAQLRAVVIAIVEGLVTITPGG